MNIKFNAPCSFNGVISPFAFWLNDDYKIGNHPLYFQTDWLSKARGGNLDPKVADGIAQIAKISEENKISFKYLFLIAMDAAMKANAGDPETMNIMSVANSNNSNDNKASDNDNSEHNDSGIDSNEANKDDESILDKEDDSDDDINNKF
jgi:hypothetical protein